MKPDSESKVVELYADGGFPLAVVNVAEECARPIGKYSFGVTKKGAASALRNLADAIDADGAIPQKVSHSTHATSDDFVMHTVSVTFAAKRS